MARTQSAETSRGVDLIRARLAAGQPPELRATAAQLGIEAMTLSRACKRAGLVLPRGRPARQSA